MKILVAADWHGKKIYAEALCLAFEKLGHEVERFSWKEYFYHYQYPNSYKIKKNILKSIYYRFQNKFTIGPDVKRINRDLIARVIDSNPDLVFVYRGTHVFPSTLKTLKKMSKAKVMGYNNDDPFSSFYPFYYWRHYLKGLRFYDHVFCYRDKNLIESRTFGAKSVSILRSYYCSESNYPIVEPMDDRYKCDVVFVGHFENDGRDYQLLQLLEAGVKLKIYGPNWKSSHYYNQLRSYCGDITPVLDDYNLVLNSAKIALVYLSKINSDTYTRRCFEIPAAKTVMLSEFTKDLSENLFIEGKDVEYFRSFDELKSKINMLLEDSDYRKYLVDNAYKRLKSDGHEVLDRAKEIIRYV